VLSASLKRQPFYEQSTHNRDLKEIIHSTLYSYFVCFIQSCIHTCYNYPPRLLPEVVLATSRSFAGIARTDPIAYRFSLLRATMYRYHHPSLKRDEMMRSRLAVQDIHAILFVKWCIQVFSWSQAANKDWKHASTCVEFTHCISAKHVIRISS
jgi:hypothetical protein